jgi:glycosyltransferase involved in cell wall biosynthesis
LSAAIHYESDGFQVNHAKPMGRHFAGHGFLSAVARHSSGAAITGYVRSAALGREFCDFVKSVRPQATTDFILPSNSAALRKVGCLYTPGTINASQAWLREFHGPGSWSLCGVNHTLSSARSMDAVTEWLTAPLQPWDAMICTSTASREVIRKLLERQAEYLSQRLGATRFVTPQLPVIPLGVDCDAQALETGRRDRARSALGLRPEHIVVLFLGRLSFHAKANPAPMYMALERLAARHSVVLIECGWVANDAISAAFAEARAKLCPSVRSIVLDGRQPEARSKAWGSADIFCSLSDNIQETFGLTPIEAMAAGLPVVVTDWDGYKDTVRNGVDGFAIPTLSAPIGSGAGLAARHAFDLDSYDVYIGQASTGVSVDIDAATAALDRLASDPELRRSMGASGASRAREAFDWKVIIRAYERLWDELAELRREHASSSPRRPDHARRFWPARPDPYELFAKFPSSLLSHGHEVRCLPGIDLEEVRARLQLKAALLDASSEISKTFLCDLWLQLDESWRTVADVLSAQPAPLHANTARALVWLSKLGLACIREPERQA